MYFLFEYIFVLLSYILYNLEDFHNIKSTAVSFLCTIYAN
jgi:hypothetical protein